MREFGDVDNGVATCEFDDGKMACFYASRTMAHGHETLTEIFGTAGRLTVGQNPRLNRVDIADAHGVRNECTPTFYERFEAAFLHETNAFRGGGARRSSAGADLARRDRSDAHRARAARIAADASRVSRPLTRDRLKTHLAPRDLLLTLAVVTLLGFSFVPIKVGLREIPPFALAALRFFFAAMPLVFFIRRPRMPWRDIAGYGFAIGVANSDCCSSASSWACPPAWHRW